MNRIKSSILGVWRKTLRMLRPLFSDQSYIKAYYYCKMGRRLNLKAPETFNEKLQWLKFNDRHPEYSMMVDKWAVKDYVAKKIGAQYVVPTLAVYDAVEEIDFDSLPQQFVLKCTHDSGGVVICKDKEALDRNAAIVKLKNGWGKNYYRYSMEYPYKDVQPRIIAEQFLSDNGAELADYKVHCFNGEPRLILVCKDRHAASGLTEDFFTAEWKHLGVRRPEHPNAKQPIEKPEELDRLLELSRELANGIPFVRVDFYISQHKIYFGELTFFPASGMTPFVPESFARLFGSWLQLPSE